MINKNKGPIGVFDSGYGGLTILDKFKKELFEYDYIYLGDNARTPYGTRSFDVVYKYTLDAVLRLFDMGCHLVILACNTASAKALRTIQQKHLPHIDPNRRVLGVIRPSVEQVGCLTKSKKVGIFGTSGTILSDSYKLEINKFFPDVEVYQTACPMWVPLVENNEFNNKGGEYFIQKYCDKLMAKNNEIDTVILACTHYPILYNLIKKYLPKRVNLIAQGDIVSSSLKDYLYRHPEIDHKCSKNSIIEYYTSEYVEKFEKVGSVFINDKIKAKHIVI